MATKQQLQTKKKKPAMMRSVMLTRFKLSQQKEKKEKESQDSNPEQLLKSPSIPKQKTSRTNKSPKKCKKDTGVQNVETTELHPNKLKRDKFVKKVLLKPKHKMIIIGRSNGSKRKINEFKDEIKTSTPKRKKTSSKIPSFNSCLEANERSQSPIYSELGFEEIIRMAEENHNLSDEDLMEILTCPSPVWWEDPPDETFIEGPIILKSMNSNITTVVPQRSKHSRKKTPHKIITESQIHKEDRTDFITIIDTKSLNTKSKSDYKFNNKRSKLENLLCTIKNKLSETTVDIVNEKESRMEPEKRVDVGNETAENNKDNSESLDEDTLLPDISPIDSDCLEHLENMVIPIEKKGNLEAVEIDPKIIETILGAETNDIKVLKETSKGNPLNNYPSLEKNKKFKIFKRSNPKRVRNMAKETITEEKKTKEEKQELIDNKVYNSYTMKNKISPKTRHKLLKQNNKTNTYITDSEDDLPDHTNTDSDFEEYMTVFKIVSSDEAHGESEIIDVDESTPVTKDKIKNEAVVIENECTDKGKLNSYYKICKKAPKTSKTVKDAPETDHPSKPSKEEVNTDNELCHDCNDKKSAIVVHDTDHVKYCLKCSSIFDMEECNYCVRKEKQKQEEEERQKQKERETQNKHCDDTEVRCGDI